MDEGLRAKPDKDDVERFCQQLGQLEYDAQGVPVMQQGNLNLDLIRRASQAVGALETLETVQEAARHKAERA